MIDNAELYVGLMSGTSADGVDGVIVEWPESQTPRVRAHAYEPFDASLRQHLLSLNRPGHNELARAVYAGSAIARIYARVTHRLLSAAQVNAQQVRAIGAHGQTVRHRPGPLTTSHDNDPVDARGYSLQLLNGALLAELTGIDVVCDFRSRDVAAGGQGAPLVPAVHQALFSQPGVDIAVLNLGGIANLSLLPSLELQQAGHPVLGFDCGPGNALMDVWCERHGHGRYDAEGRWAATGRVHDAWLDTLMQEPYFKQPAPKSTGRDLFDQPWLERQLNALEQRGEVLKSQDVQATLAELTARSVVEALLHNSPDCGELLVCGGGALNTHLMQRIRNRLPAEVRLNSTQTVGIPVDQVEALAFAWLASARLERQPGNLPAVTGASSFAVLGAVYAGTANGSTHPRR